MAPNNGLSTSTKKSSSSSGAGTDTTTTTILKAGTVEDRGMGCTNITNRDVISQQIQNFLHGEGRLSPKAELRGFFTVWTFVTRLPGPTWVDHHPGYLMRGMAYFPLSGALIGIFVSAFFDLCCTVVFDNVQLSPTPTTTITILSSIVSETASLWITGCFHEDGLADSSDGIGGGWSRDQILKIMTDTRLGTYGCAVLLLYMIAKLELIAALGESVWSWGYCSGGGPAIVVTHTLARLTAPLLIKTRDYVDEQGPKYKFYSFFVEAKHLVTWYRVLFATATSFLISTMMYGMFKAACLIVCVLVAVLVSGRYAEYLLGGVMGDYLGATICVSEVFLLVAITLLPHIQDRVIFIKEFVVLVVELFNFSGTSTSSFDETLEMIFSDVRKSTLVRFIAVALFTVVWCSNVGHPPVFVRKSVEAKEETDDVQISLKKNDNNEEQGMTESDSDSESALEITLKDPNQNFVSRYEATRSYLDSLAKPVGSLGTLEDWAARLAALQSSSKLNVENPFCLIFVGDHGVAKDESDGGASASAYPQFVTEKVLIALENKMAGASVLAAENEVRLGVVDVGCCRQEAFENNDVVSLSEHKIIGGTKNFCKACAMSKDEMNGCILAGRQEVRKHMKNTTSGGILLLGEVGIGNTTASSALIAAVTGETVETLCGSGATKGRVGDESIVTKKIAIIKEAIRYHGANTMLDKPYAALQNVGGAEIAAMVGGFLEASELNIPCLVDGFIVTTAAMIACQISPSVCRVLLFATKSTEKGHAVAINTIKKIAKENKLPDLPEPALHMNLRMGEGTGALMALPILRSAKAVLADLAPLDKVLGLQN